MPSKRETKAEEEAGDIGKEDIGFVSDKKEGEGKDDV